MPTIVMREIRQYQVDYLHVSAHVRYWEDAKVNGIEDTEGTLIPGRKGDLWEVLINLEYGHIKDWPEGVVANIHYKVCDAGTYTLLNDKMEQIKQLDGYVPSILSPGGNGYGDYIVMNVDGSGTIENWEIDLQYFEEDDDGY